MKLFDHKGNYSGRLGAFAHQVRRRSQSIAGLHRQQGKEDVFPACALFCRTSGQALVHYHGGQKFQPLSTSRYGVAQVSRSAPAQVAYQETKVFLL